MGKVVHKVKHWIDLAVLCGAGGEITGTKKDELVTCKKCLKALEKLTPNKEKK